MLKAKCIKGTYTYKNEQHRFLDVNVGDERLFEFSFGVYWFMGYVEKIGKNFYLTARGLPPQYFFEMFEVE